jgi:hypothetical protein
MELRDQDGTLLMSVGEASGPAFPIFIDSGQGVEWHKGMTLRDYFAAKAMQGMLSASENYQTRELARYAFDVADAMLKARTA